MTFGRTIPALPVTDVTAAATFYAERLGFEVAYSHPGFARVVRDECEIHLWEAGDDSWRDRADFANRPVCTGAETFIAGTASCRVQVDDAGAVHTEMAAAGVLHYTDTGAAQDTDYGTREVNVTDLENNLITFYEVT